MSKLRKFLQKLPESRLALTKAEIKAIGKEAARLNDSEKNSR